MWHRAGVQVFGNSVVDRPWQKVIKDVRDLGKSYRDTVVNVIAQSSKPI